MEAMAKARRVIVVKRRIDPAAFSRSSTAGGETEKPKGPAQTLPDPNSRRSVRKALLQRMRDQEGLAARGLRHVHFIVPLESWNAFIQTRCGGGGEGKANLAFVAWLEEGSRPTENAEQAVQAQGDPRSEDLNPT